MYQLYCPKRECGVLSFHERTNPNRSVTRTCPNCETQGIEILTSNGIVVNVKTTTNTEAPSYPTGANGLTI